ncbi:beta-ketoacyl-[acyl-carrier-protein] synthase family protein [Candidatus Daviesbacteria bacterium]|nr:beta-ketoacyl-[acyl-carrier-protein] synthase family protein [Candidatus Daviesbacteria bacterium]
MRRRPEEDIIVVTGVGTVNPLALNARDTLQAVKEGRSGVGLYEPLDPNEPLLNSQVKLAAQVKGFDPNPFLTPRDLRRVHRSAALSTVAVAEALQDAGLLTDLSRLVELTEIDKLGSDYRPLDGIEPGRIGIRLGTGIGGSTYIAEVQKIIDQRGDNRVPAIAMQIILADRVEIVPSQKFQLKGPAAVTVSACASSGMAMGDALDKLRARRADVMVSGGVDSAFHPVAYAAFNNMRALSRRNDSADKASTPFDQGAAGFIQGEGAGIVVLERYPDAKARGAKIYAEFADYADTADAFHDTAPSGEGAVRAMRNALAYAYLNPSDIDYINAHGTSTPIGDRKELEGITEVFGDHTARLYISSSKSMIGHILGGAGGVEAVITLKAMEAGIIPPTINLINAISEGMNLVPNKALYRKYNRSMSNTFGFGGHNNSIIFNHPRVMGMFSY